MALDDVILTRTAYRDELRKAVAAAADERLEKVEGGPWDGVPVLTEPKLLEAINAVFDLPVPTPSDRHAEVVTPATITVAAVCPRCDLPTTILLAISPELRVDDSGAEIHVKTKTKPRSHICGQQELPLGHSDDEKEDLEQMSFLEAVAGAAAPISAEELLDLLSLVRDEFTPDAFPTLEEINRWTEPVREQVKEWATATYNLPSDATDDDAPTLPKVLGGEDEPAEADDHPTDTPLGLEDDQAGEEGDPE